MSATTSWSRTCYRPCQPGSLDLGRRPLVVQTLTFQTLFVLFFISHGCRKLVHFEVTGHPTAAWVWRQLIEATAWNSKPDYLIHDRDRVWGADFGGRTLGLGIKSLRTPIRAPRANAIAERWVGPSAAIASTN
jgi:putative transposase